MLSVRAHERKDIFQISTGVRPLSMRISKWNDRGTGRGKAAGVVEGMDRAVKNCMRVDGKGLAEINY